MVNNAKGANQPASAERTVGAMLARAAAIGHEVEAIQGDVGLQRLSRVAWVRECLKLGSFADLADLEAARAKLDVAPYLAAEVERTAVAWVRDFQPDPPSHWLYGDGLGYRAASYGERFALGLTIDEVSAVTAYIAAELAPPSFFGHLDDRDEPERMLAPLYDELGQLDHQLHVDLRCRDIVWEAGRGTLRVGAVVVMMDQSTVGAVASFVARASRDALRTQLQAAA